MDSSSINPAKGPDIQAAKPAAASEKPVSSPAPTAEVKAAPKDTVSLSPAAKSALESGTPEVTQEASTPEASPADTVRESNGSKNESADLGLDKSRKLSLTDANDVVVKIIDNKTKEVVKQIPSEEELQLRNAVRDGVENIAPKNNPTEDLI
jgi:flagellar protein FlaG